MQTHGGFSAEEAIVSIERRFHIDLQVDWNRNGQYDHDLSDLSRYADNVVVDRSLSGSAPSEIMLIDGASAAELEFTLGGEDTTGMGLNFVAVFSPYNGFSPLYVLDPVGCEVKYRIGVDTDLGVIWYSQFIGNVRTITPNRGQNTVTITALDRVEKLRVPVRFPVWAMSAYSAQRGYELAQLMNSQWVIDHCLRFGDTSSTPFRPMYDYEFTKSNPENDKGIRFWLTGTGSHVPTVGQVDDNNSQGFPKTEAGAPPMYYPVGMPHPGSPETTTLPLSLSALGPDNSGWATSGIGASNHNRYWGLDRNTTNFLSHHYIGFTLNEAGPNGAWWRGTDRLTSVVECHLGFHIKLVITLYQGHVRGEIRNYNTTGGVVTPWYPVPTADHSAIGIKFHLGNGAANSVFGVFCNGALLGSGVFDDWSSRIDGSFDPFTGCVNVSHIAGIGDVFWGNRWGGPGGPGTDDEFSARGGRKAASYAAVLDVGKNELTHLPATSSEDAWDTITAVAAAELGSVFWDEHGTFHFWNRDRIVSLQSEVVRTFSLDDVAGLQITDSLDSVRNVITAQAAKSLSQTESVFESSSIEDFYVPGGTRRTFTFYPGDIQSVYPLQIHRYRTSDTEPATLPLWDNNVDMGYVAQWLRPAGWQEQNDFSGGLEIFCYLNEDGSLSVEIWNAWAEPARLATGDVEQSSSAAFRLRGSSVSSGQELIVSARDTISIAKYGLRNFPISGDWVQWQPSVTEQLVNYVLPRTVHPIPTTDAITIAGDPRLQLGDTLAIQDPDGIGEEMKMQIYGINRTFSRNSGLTDTLTVEMIRPPRVGIWNSSQYGRWDRSLIWSA